MMRSLAISLAAAGLYSSAAPLHAQSALFLDRSYVVRMDPDRGLLYEAQPAVPLYLHSGIRELYSGLRDPDPSWSGGTMLVLVPMFRIRQLTDKEAPSSPVRLPSFMPKLTAQYVAARRIGGYVHASEVEYPLSAMILGISGSFGHYSNGQAGCFRANELVKPDGSGDCIVDPNAAPGADTLNTVDGSFSTWYLQAQTHIRFAHYTDSLPLFTFTIHGGVDWHPAFLEPIGGMDSALAMVYGRIRPFGGAELMRRSQWGCPSSALLAWLPCGYGRVRTSMSAEYIPTHPAGISSVATTSELAWTFSRWAGLGPIVRLHTGQDYYNIALGHELNVLQFGFTFDLERDQPIRARTSTR
jgi:hypothetical protein